MKFKVLAGLLFLSLLFNAAGIVFLVGFIGAKSDVKSLKKERNQIERNLTMVQMAASAHEKEALAQQATAAKVQLLDRVVKRNFVSHLDGVEDQLAVRMPQWKGGPRDYTLVVYFHGMGSTMMEPFLVPSDISAATAMETVDRDTCILSCSYRPTASWLNDAAYADINQNIRHVLQELPFKRIVVAGTSMGGCTALNYAAVAPPDIREKISGVICVEGAGDLAALYKQTGADSIRSAMQAALGGTPDTAPQVYTGKSFINNMDNLPKSVRFAIVSVDQDTVVPSALQFDVVKQLQAKQFPVLHIALHGVHHPPAWSAYADAYRYVMSKS